MRNVSVQGPSFVQAMCPFLCSSDRLTQGSPFMCNVSVQDPLFVQPRPAFRLLPQKRRVNRHERRLHRLACAYTSGDGELLRSALYSLRGYSTLRGCTKSFIRGDNCIEFDGEGTGV